MSEERIFSTVLTDLKNGSSANNERYEKRVCPKHGEYTARIIDFNGMEAVSMCPICESEQIRKEQVEHEKNERKQYLKKCEECNIEPEFFDKRLSDYVPKTLSQKQALEAVRKMIAEKHGKIVLLGPNGVGKTMLASIATRELGGKIYTMYEISAMIRQCFTVKAEKSELEITKELASIPFLAIDEMCRSKGSDSELNWLSWILDKRHARRLPFMLLSNGHFMRQCPNHGCNRCFENFIDSDVLSRLQEDSSIIIIDGPDDRQNHHQ